MRIAIVTDGVYFRRNTVVYNNYNTDCDINPACAVVHNFQASINFNVNTQNSVNVYFIESGRSGVGRGAADQDTRFKAFNLIGTWRSRAEQIANPSIWWHLSQNSQTFLHELAHCLSLNHNPSAGNVVFPNIGATCNYDDFCNDTPTNVCNSTWNCPANSTTCSNNLMSYNNGTALSHCQLGRIHWTLENEIPENKLCHYVLANLNVNSNTFNASQSLYQARTITVGSLVNTLVVQGGRSVTLVAENSVTINNSFEVQLGSEFEIKIEPGCN